jgi:hypothetical protein
MSTELFNSAKSILATWGEFEVYNVVRLVKVYRDNKLTIIGLFDRDNRVFERIFITLNMQEETSPPQAPLFHLPIPLSAKESLTVVYSAYRLSETEFVAEQYMRPGRWERYLEQLMTKAQEADRRLGELNRMPIDDSKLFPDLDAPSK